MERYKIQPAASKILSLLKNSGFRAYLVGGCVRDILMRREPKDWDICTSAKPAEIQKLFPRHFYDNKFGTVTVLPSKTEVTTFRKDALYSDKRHPDSVLFSNSLEEDLARRDFTINAIAFDASEFIDPFGGREDIERGLIKAVGVPEARFQEDALRLLRAIRFSVQLGFKIELKTKSAIKPQSQLLEFIAKERVRDELAEIIMSGSPARGLELLRELKLLDLIFPELLFGVGVSQNKHHKFDVYEHSLRSLAAAATKDFSLSVRLAALFHDIAKPETKQGQGKEATFYSHEIVGAAWSRRILERLCFERDLVKKITLLVRWHMFFSDPEKVTESAARRLLRKVGRENIQDLINLRIADRLGSGVPKARPYRLRRFEYLLDKVSRDPLDETMLKINGNELMQILQIKPGKRVGLLLRALLNEVLDDPKRNKKSYLEKRLKALHQLNDQALEESAKELGLKQTSQELLERRRFGV